MDTTNKTNTHTSSVSSYITPAVEQAFETYTKELLLWNEQMNLTSITAPEDIKIKHFEDSLTLLPVFETLYKETRDTSIPLHLIDIGTGAGFPGLPIAIVLPNIQVTLVESVGKKVAFLNHIIETLHLENCVVENARAEEVGQHIDYREHYDIATARAVALLPVLCEYLLPLVKVGGYVIAQKISTPEEIASASYAIEVLGGTLQEVREVKLSNNTIHHLIIIRKIKTTPKEFPRLPGTPSKKPLL